MKVKAATLRNFKLVGAYSTTLVLKPECKRYAGKRIPIILFGVTLQVNFIQVFRIGVAQTPFETTVNMLGYVVLKAEAKQIANIER